MKLILNVWSRIILFGFMLMLISSQSYTQSYQKHPRAMELERQMTKDALDFLKSRFPDFPVIVTVAIDPLYRVDRSAIHNKPKGENLPFFRSEEEEILDEWDDPSLPNAVLLSRVKKIVVNVSAPGHLTDDEVAEIKQSLSLNLNLLPARDTIEIIKRSWGQKKEPEFNPYNYIWIAGGLFLIFFISLLFAIWTPIRQIVRVLREGVSMTKGGGSASPGVIMPLSGKSSDSGGGAYSESSNRHQQNKSDMRFSDPIKLQTAISLFLNNLMSIESFPNLNDMIFLDDLCKENPSLVGALLFECPNNLREKIFSFSYGNHWLEALLKPGSVDIRVFEMAHKLNRMSRPPTLDPWEYLLLVVWRLGDRRGEFLRELNQADAFALLNNLPKAIALKTAREMWPGSWAVLLDPNYQPKKLTDDSIASITNEALKMFPIRTMESLRQFRQDKDLMDFLGTVDPATERDIYVASAKDSILHQVRPPFFRVFDASEKNLAELVTMIGLPEWALALSNVPAKDRKKIEAAFNSKQKQRYNELYEQIEASSPDLRVVSEARGKIAEMLNRLIENQMMAEINATDVSMMKEDDDHDKKAA